MIKRLFFILLIPIVLCISGCKPQEKPIIIAPAVAPKPKPIENVRIALALGTGGFLGIAHLGVIEVLEQEGIPIDLIVGSSAGSLIGVFYCDRPNALKIKSQVIAIRKENLVNSSSPPITGLTLEKFLYCNLHAKNFEELKIPLVAVATAYEDNQPILLRSGPIAPAVHASSALPFLFAPVRLYGKLLTDGGVLEPVPVSSARKFNPKIVIAVNVTPIEISNSSNYGFPKLNKVIKRTIDISYSELSRCEAETADIVIRPDLNGFQSMDDQHNAEIYERGRKAAKAAIPAIKRKMLNQGIALKN